MKKIDHHRKGKQRIDKEGKKKNKERKKIDKRTVAPHIKRKEKGSEKKKVS